MQNFRSFGLCFVFPLASHFSTGPHKKKTVQNEKKARTFLFRLKIQEIMSFRGAFIKKKLEFPGGVVDPLFQFSLKIVRFIQKFNKKIPFYRGRGSLIVTIQKCNFTIGR